MNRLVKVLVDDDGVEYTNDFWHLHLSMGGGPTVFCTGEFFGFGESGVEFETKTVKRGGITCPDCLAMIKEIKSVKL